MNPTLSPVAADLLETLTRRVRLISLVQLKELWQISARNRRVLRRRVSRLCAARLLEVHTINVQISNPAGPLFAWRPGDDEPDAEALARLSQMRWQSPAAPTTVCVASRLAANLFGSTSAGLPKVEHRNHDLLLAAVYICYRLRCPNEAALWVGEHAIPKAGFQIKDPDAFLIGGQGQVIRVIESAGRYRPCQIESFHEHCADEGLPYELW
jgi:hypothetical protein